MVIKRAIMNSTAWIINSDASNYITADRKLFVNSKNIKQRSIFTAESIVLWATEISKVKILLWKSETLLIKNILEIFKLSNSLLFIP